MIRLDVDGRFFHVEFRHERRRFAAELAAPHPDCAVIRALTTCVIVAMKSGEIGGIEMEPTPIAFLAIGTAICWDTDQFSFHRGRLKAFANALDRCGALLGVKARLWQAYFAIDPDPPPRVPTPKLSEAIKRARWEAGWQVRLNRRGAQPDRTATS